MNPSRMIATWFGCGLSPLAPGTVGSVAGVVCVYLIGQVAGWLGVVLFAGLTIATGFAVSGPVARAAGEKDPGFIVVDEVAGMALAALPVWNNFLWLVVVFGLFRVLDIWKPWPIRLLEQVPGGSGIMLDDLAGGLIAAVVVSVPVHLL